MRIQAAFPKNQSLVDHLQLVTQLKSLNYDNPFSIKAFDNATKIVASLGVSFEEVNLFSFHGIGQKLIEEIREFQKTGTSTRYQILAKQFPIEMFSMTIVHGVGARRALLFYNQGYHNFTELHQAALENKLDTKLQDAVLLAATKHKSRIPSDIVLPLATRIKNYLSNLNLGEVEIAGSLRRKLPTVKDIDFAFCLNNLAQKQQVVDTFFSLGKNPTGAESKYSIQIAESNYQIQADLWIGEANYWGTLLNHTTGSKEHNIAIRTLAKSKGMTISEYGIFRDSKRIGGAQETDLYQILNLPYVEPENRNGTLPHGV